MLARRPVLLALVAVCLASCQTSDPAQVLAVSGVETYWVVDSPQAGENFVAPAVRFRVRNTGQEPLGSIDARARFPSADQGDEVWGSIQEQVSSWRSPL